MRSTILFGTAALFASAMAETTVYVTVIPPECSARECMPSSSSLNALEVLTAALATYPNALSALCSAPGYTLCPTPQSVVTLTTTASPSSFPPLESTTASSAIPLSTSNSASQSSESLHSSPTAAPTTLPVPTYPLSSSVASVVTPSTTYPVVSTSSVPATYPAPSSSVSIPASSSAASYPAPTTMASSSVASPVTGSSSSVAVGSTTTPAHSSSIAGPVTGSATATNAPPVGAGNMVQPSLMGLGAILGALLFI